MNRSGLQQYLREAFPKENAACSGRSRTWLMQSPDAKVKISPAIYLPLPTWKGAFGSGVEDSSRCCALSAFSSFTITRRRISANAYSVAAAISTQQASGSTASLPPIPLKPFRFHIQSTHPDFGLRTRHGNGWMTRCEMRARTVAAISRPIDLRDWS
jgi:hypothetical protein